MVFHERGLAGLQEVSKGLLRGGNRREISLASVDNAIYVIIRPVRSAAGGIRLVWPLMRIFLPLIYIKRAATRAQAFQLL